MDKVWDMQENVFKNLLEEVKLIIATNYGERFKQGKEFNVFLVEGISSNEVRVCRFIRELIDPKGSHGQGDIFLRRFMIDVLKVNESDFCSEDYLKTNVVCEKLISESRRIDLVIRISDKIYPIEVKVYAKDQDRQCEDYYNYAVKIDKKCKLYYLTLDGHEPSKESKGILTKEQYEKLSFRKEILCWLDNCILMEEIEQIYSVREILIQFRDVIRRLTGANKEKYEMEIKNIIFDSQTNMEAAMQIAKVLPDVKTDMMLKVFSSINKYICDNYDSIIDKEKSYESYVNEVKEYYRKEKKTWPSINYIISVDDENINGKLALRFEIDERLYFGICPWTGTSNNGIDKTTTAKDYVDEKLTPTSVLDRSMNKYWYWWAYLNRENDVNFWYCNSEYIKLYDSKGFEEYMAPVYATIDEMMKYIDISRK